MLHDDYRARCGHPSDIWEHLPTLHTLAHGKEVIELGVRSGNSTCAFLAAIEEDGGHLWSVDSEQPRVPEEWAGLGFWTLIVGNDLHVADQLPDACDVLFVDTSHAFDHTLAELVLYGPRVRTGGVIVLHDTTLEQPENVGPHPPFPVREAIDRYCEVHGYAWTNNTACNGLGIVEVV